MDGIKPSLMDGLAKRLSWSQESNNLKPRLDEPQSQKKRIAACLSWN
jgi:hypothetical protein